MTRSTSLPGLRTRQRPFRLALMGIALIATAACSSDDDSPTAPTPEPEIVLSETSVTIVRGAGETAQVEATVEGATGTVTYESAHPAIATVDANGVITPVADGQTFIIARLSSDPSINKSVVVNVVSTIVQVSANGAWTWVGGPTRTVTATVTNNANTAVTWRSSNPAVATVVDGVVTPVSAGSATIIATSVGDPSKEAGTLISVDPAPNTTPTLLTSGVGVGGLSAPQGTPRYFRIEVPPGATELKVAISGVAAGTDIDLFVQAATAPNIPTTAADYASNQPVKCVAATAAGNETCTIANPPSRVYFILIDAYQAYTGATITATLKP